LIIIIPKHWLSVTNTLTLNGLLVPSATEHSTLCGGHSCHRKRVKIVEAVFRVVEKTRDTHGLHSATSVKILLPTEDSDSPSSGKYIWTIYGVF